MQRDHTIYDMQLKEKKKKNSELSELIMLKTIQKLYLIIDKEQRINNQ